MSIESSIEEKIRQAIARGEFDNLRGKGKPLDLDAYFNTPEDLRMAFSMLKSNEFVPEEVEILNQIAALNEKIRSSSQEAEIGELTQRLNDKKLALTVKLETYRRKR